MRRFREIREIKEVSEEVKRKKPVHQRMPAFFDELSIPSEITLGVDEVAQLPDEITL